MYGCELGDVARRRAGAIEHLADALDVQRGEDLGSVLKALLEPATWGVDEAAVGEEFDRPATTGDRAGAAGGEPGATPDEPQPFEPPPAPVALSVVPEPPAEEPNGDTPTPLRPPDPPVLDMLAAREREEDARPPRAPRAGAVALAAAGIAALLGAAGLVGATQFGDDGPTAGREGEGDDGTRSFVPAGAGPLAAPFASDPRTESCYSTAYVRRAIVLHRAPGGRRRLRLPARTEWRSPRVLGVVTQRAGWLGVQAAELRNGELGWIPRDRARVDCVRWSLHADLSERRLYVRKDGDTVRQMRIAVGSSQHSTPVGRFSVTDKLEVADTSSPYGCCVLALSGHQNRLPPDWPGGDRLAVHATTDLASIGKAVSLGCMRSRTEQARWLIETIPLGAPIFVHS